MTKCECNLVRKRLESYQWHKQRIVQEKARIQYLEEVYKSRATPSAIPIERNEGSCGHVRSKESGYLDIFDKQREAEERIRTSLQEMKRIEQFINSIDSDQRNLLELAYLKGKRYREIGEKIGYTKEGVYKKIGRCLERVPHSSAEASGLL